ncbi:MAG: hypothetical protein IKD11_01165, partial [Oscillospiraceae bacterium]|nr:hypothetical protein [Oscillospiraceae bacterium]
AKVFLKRLQRWRRGTAVYAALLFLFAVCIAVFGGAMYDALVYVHYLCMIYAGCIFYAVLSRIHRENKDNLDAGAMPVSKENYPTLYAIAERAAKANGCRGPVLLRLSPDCNASILEISSHYILNLGVLLLGVLSEEELYSICLHEFSHCSKKNRAAKRELRYGVWVMKNKNVYFIMSFVTNLFIYPDMRYLFDHITYEYATSVANETDADRDMAALGSPAVAASALLKVNYYDFLTWELSGKGTPSPFEGEELPAHELRDRIALFRTAIDERHADWDEMIMREILPNNATHPTLRMRFETLGVREPAFTPDESTPAYVGEVARAVDELDRAMLCSDETYAELRREHYLEPLARVTAWQDAGMPISPETHADIFTDLRKLGRFAEAEALCDRVIAELDENSSWSACHAKGCLLLFRYDEAGMEYIYRAVEKNLNFLEDGMVMIGRFCCMTGREEDLRLYRERMKVFAQRDKDEYEKASYLARGDTLTTDTDIPAEMKENILSYILSVDEGLIRRIYLVRKHITDDFATSAFVIHFYGGTEEQREEIRHKIFSYLDSYPADWQFSLLDIFECRGIRFDKIEGCLIYEKTT